MSTEGRGFDEGVGGGEGGAGGDVGTVTGVTWEEEGRGDDGCVDDAHLSTPSDFNISSTEVDQLLEGQGTLYVLHNLQMIFRSSHCEFVELWIVI